MGRIALAHERCAVAQRHGQASRGGSEHIPSLPQFIALCHQAREFEDRSDLPRLPAPQFGKWEAEANRHLLNFVLKCGGGKMYFDEPATRILLEHKRAWVEDMTTDDHGAGVAVEQQQAAWEEAMHRQWIGSRRSGRRSQDESAAITPPDLPFSRQDGSDTLWWQMQATQASRDWEREYRFHATRLWRFDLALPHLKLAVDIEEIGPAGTAGRHQRIGGFQADLEKYAEAWADGWQVCESRQAGKRPGTG